MRIRDLGEFELIESIARAAGPPGRSVALGIGDDAAVLRVPANREIATSVDALVEGVHFRFDWESPRRIGARALLSSLSDLAAMGAAPLGATLAATLPPDLPAGKAKDLARGAIAAGKRYGCPLVGGNLARAEQVSLTVSVFGSVARGRALKRSAARRGDRIFITGVLGRPALARKRLEAGENARLPLPTPRLQAGRRLARLPGVGACIDLSDGLVSDLGHVLVASGVGALLDWSALPKARGFDSQCRRLALDPADLLLAGGEEYELLFSGGRRFPSAAVLSRRLGVEVTEIGRVTAGELRWSDGVDRRAAGWRHF